MLQPVTSLSEDQLTQLVEMNLANVPAVNAIDADEFRGFLSQAELFGLVEQDKNLAGFIIALGPGHTYESLNYQYFNRNFSGFLYVDRIVIGEQYRRLGLGRKIYQALEQLAAVQNVPHLCCEVNLRPSNIGSMLFHTELGFEQVASQETEGGKKEVALLVKTLEIN